MSFIDAYLCHSTSMSQIIYVIVCTVLVNCSTQSRLTHWGRDIMAAIFQMAFSNAFSWLKMLEFHLNFHLAWCRPGDKTLSEPMMVSLLTHICFTQPQWFNTLTCLKETNIYWFIVCFRILRWQGHWKQLSVNSAQLEPRLSVNWHEFWPVQ